MKYTTQGKKHSNYIQIYSTVVQNTSENLRIGEPTLLLIKMITPDAKEYT